MALAVVNKINQFDKAIASLQEALNAFKTSLEPRFKRIEKEVQRLTEKVDELSSTMDACFTDSTDSNLEIEIPSMESTLEASEPEDEFSYDADGTLLVSANRKEELEARGYVVVGTTTKDSKTLLKMKQA